MSEMVKRVATAMAALRRDAEGGGAIMDVYGDLAVAAIEAMREPTEAMLSVDCPAMKEIDGAIHMAAVHGYLLKWMERGEVPPLHQAWRSMIDAALKVD